MQGTVTLIEKERKKNTDREKKEKKRKEKENRIVSHFFLYYIIFHSVDSAPRLF